MVMTQAQVRSILDSDFQIKGDVEIQSDLSVNVDGDVKMIKPAEKGILPIKFAKVDGAFMAVGMKLTSLQNMPDTCGGLFVRQNKLTSLEGCPVYLSTLDCSDNQINSLQHGPDSVIAVNASGNPLTSLEGLADELDYVNITFDPHLPLLRLLNADKIHVGRPGGGYNHLAPFQPVHDILNKYAGQGKQGAIKAAAELVKLGFKDNARW